MQLDVKENLHQKRHGAKTIYLQWVCMNFHSDRTFILSRNSFWVKRKDSLFTQFHCDWIVFFFAISSCDSFWKENEFQIFFVFKLLIFLLLITFAVFHQEIRFQWKKRHNLTLLCNNRNQIYFKYWSYLTSDRVVWFVLFICFCIFLLIITVFT